MNAIAVPEQLRHLSGRILDPDTHEMMPAQVWATEIGPIMEDLANHWMNNGVSSKDEINHPNVTDYSGDQKVVDPATIYAQKGCVAPGAVDVERRLEVMDAMGIQRQLMFPTAGLFGAYLLYLDPNYGFSSGVKHTNHREYGYQLLHGYNEWGKKIAKVSNRIRPVLPLIAETPAELIATAKDLVDNGIRAIWMPSGVLPGGVSPAHPDLDPLWSMFEAKKVSLLLHGGLDSNIFGTDAWWDVPAFKGYKVFGEFRLDPWSVANTHTTTQNFITTMILGGLFDRFPELRAGIFESGTMWIGHCMENLDMWYAQDLGGVRNGEERNTYRIPEKPSFYMKRNIRVGALEFEPVDVYISKYDMGDMLCFSTDYPHVEGGFSPMQRMYEKVAPFGEEQVEKFFVTNAEWVLPE